jgi:hypothetical protein
MSTCKTCNGVGVVNGEPCPEKDCLAGNLARIFRDKESE